MSHFPFSDRSNCPLTVAAAEQPLVKLLILRALFDMGCINSLLREHCFDNDQVAHFLGLQGLLADYDRKKALVALQKQHRAAERSAKKAWRLSPVLSANLRTLQQLVGLSDTECRLLVFFALMHSEYVLAQVCSHWLDDLSMQASLATIASLLMVNREDVAEALSSRGKLVRCGLVSVEPGSCHSLLRRFDMLSPIFSDRLLARESTAEEFLIGAVKAGGQSTLSEKDYCHIERQYMLAADYLRVSLADKRQGVNILLHGDPGTGKTELVRLLAQQLDAGLLEVSSADEQGESLVGKQRLRAFKAAQQFFAARRTLILFDEIQDVFDDGGIFGRSTAQVRKAEINTLLEENPLPTFWLSNNIQSMDNAFIRRFDIVIELDVPPLARRRQILEDVLQNLPVPAASLKAFACHEHLAPAVVQRAAGVVRAVSASLRDDEVPQALESLFNQTLNAQGYGRIGKIPANALPDFYDPSLVNADIDLAQLAAGIAANPSARICLYGPPGTGKSAFAQWLAQTLQRPFHNKKLSDILSMWLGGTEKNLQRAFNEAEQDNAVLLLDEVDSFLQDRRQAKQGWEVTQVNEMLTQMEAFNGLFIASTNLMDNLDQAALRRFDLKIRLDYLKPPQAWQLFTKQCDAMGLEQPTDDLQVIVQGMHLLTPGDFAAVHRRHRFSPIKDAHALLNGLKEECAVKEGGQTRRIGFI